MERSTPVGFRSPACAESSAKPIAAQNVAQRMTRRTIAPPIVHSDFLGWTAVSLSEKKPTRS